MVGSESTASNGDNEKLWNWPYSRLTIHKWNVLPENFVIFSLWKC